MDNNRPIHPHTDKRPLVAIIEPNTLTMLGIKGLLESIMPGLEIRSFSNCTELEHVGADNFFHYFVSMSVVIDNMAFFSEYNRKTIVLATSSGVNALSNRFRCINVDQNEEQLVKSILMLEQEAHAHGKNLPTVMHPSNDSPLTPREVEVMTLIVKGFINKEIADMLNISLPTVITHRKNINDKLHTKSVSALTIYAVMHGYVDINNI